MNVNAQISAANALANTARSAVAKKQPGAAGLAKQANAALASAGAARNQQLAQMHSAAGKKALSHPPQDSIHIAKHK